MYAKNAHTHDAVLEACQAGYDAIVSNLELLTNMDSGSDDYPELNAKAAVIKRMCEEAGASVELVEATEPRQGTYNIIATWKGTGKAKMLFLAHYDTVWPKGEAAKRPFRIENGVAYGPGVNDRQNSIAAFPVFMDILLNKLGCRDFDTITILMNADEEKGSFGSRDLIMDLAARHDVSYSTDGSCPEGDLINVMARGTAYYEIHIKGIESHSGAAPEAGRNAGYEMAYQIMKMRDLSDKKLGTDVNWTMGSFGSKSNVIPGKAYAHANARIAIKSEWDRIEADIRRHIEDKLYPESEITFVIQRGRPPFERNPRTDALAEKIVALARQELDMTIKAVPAGGGNDTSYTFQTAPVAMEGLSLGGGNPHSIDECFNLSHIVPRLYLWLRLTEETMKGNMVPLGTAK